LPSAAPPHLPPTQHKPEPTSEPIFHIPYPINPSLFPSHQPPLSLHSFRGRHMDRKIPFEYAPQQPDEVLFLFFVSCRLRLSGPVPSNSTLSFPPALASISLSLLSPVSCLCLSVFVFPPLSLCLYLCLCLSVCLSVPLCLSVSLFVFISSLTLASAPFCPVCLAVLCC
jgi:hypothetical protein